MRTRKKFNSEKYIADFNNIKQALIATDEAFTREDLLNCLKNIGLPSSNTFVGGIVESGIIVRIGRNRYAFPDKKPVHKDLLAKAYEIYQNNNKKYRSNRKTSAEPQELPVEELPKEEPEEVPNSTPEATIQFAIDLLKENGYLIYRPAYMVYEAI